MTAEALVDGAEWEPCHSLAKRVHRARGTLEDWARKGWIRRKRGPARPGTAAGWLYNVADAVARTESEPVRHQAAFRGARCTRCGWPMEFVGLCFDCWQEFRGMAPWQVFAREGYYDDGTPF